MIGTDISLAKTLLEAGKLVGIPTETVYGLAGNAFNEQAVLEIFRVKNRPSFDPLIVHTDSLEKIRHFVQHIPPQAQQLATRFMPGALTLLLPKQSIIPDLVTSGLEGVAVRIPDHPLTLSLLSQLDFPLAAPSANPFGYISPTSARHVENQLGDKIPYILDGGNCRVGLESTIIGFEDYVPTVYRKGGLSIEAIEEVIGKVQVQAHSSSNPKAPGMLKSHYAPRIPVKLGNIEALLAQNPSVRAGIVSFKTKYPQVAGQQQVILSETGDFAEAARNLFAGLRYLDGLNLEVIYAELLPEKDLGRAINDRIRRAAAE